MRVAAAQGEPFADDAVRRLRTMGALLPGWELLEPVMWLFLSPKAWDYGAAGIGPTGWLQLGSMEPGGSDLTVMAFGALLLLLAQVFRRALSSPTSTGSRSDGHRGAARPHAPRAADDPDRAGRSVGITVANLSVLKTGKAKTARFGTLEAICRELDCQPGDLLTYVDDA